MTTQRPHNDHNTIERKVEPICNIAANMIPGGISLTICAVVNGPWVGSAPAAAAAAVPPSPPSASIARYSHVTAGSPARRHASSFASLLKKNFQKSFKRKMERRKDN